MIHSQTTACEYETFRVILNLHMTIFCSDLRSDETTYAFSKILGLKPLINSLNRSHLADKLYSESTYRFMLLYSVGNVLISPATSFMSSFLKAIVTICVLESNALIDCIAVSAEH